MIKLTPAQKTILLHRLTLTDCIAEVLASSEVPESATVSEYEASTEKRGPVIGEKAERLVSFVETHSAIPDTLDDDEREILADAIDGSTWFANEGLDAEQTPLWWASQHRAAEALEAKVSAAVGRPISFPR